ncbi:hypothetical protein CUMW_053680 [Citrus unshiu]|nr:hypothetical protein CUMW_053680 [Citrus unshiu]
MAPKHIELCLVLVLVTMLFHGAVAQSGCTTVLVGLAPCLNYITGNSSTPSSSCCSQLASVVQSQPRCLCSVLNSGGSSLGIAINQSQALALPGACNVQTPPASECNICKKITSPTQTTELAAMRLQTVLIAVIVAAAFCGGDVAAQSSDCNNVLISMSPCLDYITGNSSRPSSSCCSELSNAVKSQPQCLCEVIKGGGSSASSLGINVNQTQAMALPSACNVQTPPVSRCNAASPNSPSGNGSKTVPSTNRVDSSNATKLTFSLLFFWLFVASYTSSFSAV